MKSSTLANILLAALALPSFALALEPPPGGGYPNQTTALGDDALFNADLDSAQMNTALGYQACYSMVAGSQDVAIGSQALFSDTYGGNIAIGSFALYHNTTGFANTAIGVDALVSNVNGLENTAIGPSALESATASQNTAIGFAAMSYATTAAYNTAVGAGALAFNGVGMKNVAVGTAAMNLGASGSNDVAMGWAAAAMMTGSNNLALGFQAAENMTGSNNIALGYNAAFNLTTGSNNIEIGTEGAAKDDSVIRLGDVGTQKKIFAAGISGTTISGGAAVMVNSKGQLGVATSSARFKENIQPMKDASAAILSLQPVTFRYKKNLDPQAIPQFGLVAEDVAKVDPDLVIRDENGKPFTVRYEAVNAMLLNEFLKEHRKVESQDETINVLEKRVSAQDKVNSELRDALKAQAAQIQKVSAQVQANHAKAQLVSTNQ